MPVVFHIFQFVFESENNKTMNILSVTSSCLMVIFFYGIDAFFMGTKPEVPLPSYGNDVNVFSDNSLVIIDSSSSTGNNFEIEQSRRVHNQKSLNPQVCILYDTFHATNWQHSEENINKDCSIILSTSNDNMILDSNAENSEFRLQYMNTERYIHSHVQTSSTNKETSIRILNIFKRFLPRYLYRYYQREDIIPSQPDRDSYIIREGLKNWQERHSESVHDATYLTSNYQEPIVIGNRRVLWLYGSLFNIFYNVNYTFLIYFTLYLQAEASNNDTLTILFMFYVLICTFLRVIIKRIGLAIDKRKMHTVSMFFAAEFMCLMFYYTFYRVLFESISEYYVFIILETSHLAFEWIFYPIRASETYCNFVTSLERREGKFSGILVEFLSPYGLNCKDWQNFVALDFGIRFLILVASGLNITITLLTIAWSPWIENSLKETGIQLEYTLLYISISVVVEIGNVILLNRLFFKPRQLDIKAMLKQCFQEVRFAFITTIIASVLFINPVYAFTTGNEY